MTEEDYSLLGLRSDPAPSSAEIREAFRKMCLLHHPDLQHAKGERTEEERAECEERFARIVQAHRSLRERHPAYLDGVR